MALRDLLKLSDDKLEERFNAKPYDPAKDRQKVLAALKRTREQHSATGVVRGRKWFSRKNDVTKFAPPFSIGGKSTLYIPSERFNDFVGQLEGAVRAGELDEAIAAGGSPSTSRRGGTGQKRGPWSPERRAAYEASKRSGG